MLTLDQLKAMPPHTVFATGTVPNSPEGVFMTRDYPDKPLLWIAKRGEIPDWTIYIHWEEMGKDFVISNGDKVLHAAHIKKLVSCDDEAFAQYRF